MKINEKKQNSPDLVFYPNKNLDDEFDLESYECQDNIEEFKSYKNRGKDMNKQKQK